MPVQAVNKTQSNIKHHDNKVSSKQHQQTFTGSFNPVVTLMDAIDRGGFAASFIAQDGIGMVAPRIYEGLNRNREKDENGKKTGPLNWEFARREGIREVLSGPSAFLIPMGIMALIKKYSGTANNVHINHISALGDEFGKYASANPSHINSTATFKKGYYTKVFENLLSNSTDKSLNSSDITAKSRAFADKLISIENLRSSGKKKDAKKLQGELVEEYMNLRKLTTEASSNNLDATLKYDNKTLNTDIRRLTQSMTDYTNDALEKLAKYVKNESGDIKGFVKKFNLHRAGTRVVSNLGMWGSVVGFYSIIPKLYNLGLKHDPGLKGLEEPEEKKNKDVAFTGNFFTKAGETALKDGPINKILKNFEFNGASMPVSAMLTLLFGFTLPTRYLNAKSDKERKEILVRDISSFTAILFGAKALSRIFSVAFAKLSGLALNIKPADHSKNLFNKIKNYVTAGGGINVLSSEQIVSKYSNLGQYKDGINGFFKFLEENGGDIKKVLKLDKRVRQNAEIIIGKPIDKASVEEIKKAFDTARKSRWNALEDIYTVFSAKDNRFINRAKTLNSAFGFASTLVLVPAFMMWLARYCEKMTKKAVEKEKAQRAAEMNNLNQTKQIEIVQTNKPTMAGFLNN